MCLKSTTKGYFPKSDHSQQGSTSSALHLKIDAQKFFRKASDENHVERTYTGATWNLYISTSPYIDHQLRSEASFLFSSLCLPCDESLRFEKVPGNLCPPPSSFRVFPGKSLIFPENVRR
ncbi:hypothetical protein AAG906_009025 [Vitis piasezkii]